MTYHIPKLRQILPLLLLCLLSLKQANGLTTDRDQPIHINADRMVAEEPKGYSHYIGNVHMTQGSLLVDADEVYIYVIDGELDKLIIIGEPAKLQQLPDNSSEPVYSRAKRMEYFANIDRLLLIKDAEVWQGANRFSGERIEYDTRNSRVSANSQGKTSGRIRAVITPKKDLTKKSATSETAAEKNKSDEMPTDETQVDETAMDKTP